MVETETASTIAAATTAMRDLCVEKVKVLRAASAVGSDPFVNGAHAAYNAAIDALNSIALDQVEKKQ